MTAELNTWFFTSLPYNSQRARVFILSSFNLYFKLLSFGSAFWEGHLLRVKAEMRWVRLDQMRSFEKLMAEGLPWWRSG